MLLGLNPGAWMFWTNAVAAVVVIVMIVVSRRVFLVAVLGALLNVAAASLIWAMQGACVLPQPDLVEFRQGMTICPGQGARVRIEVPQPATSKDP